MREAIEPEVQLTEQQKKEERQRQQSEITRRVLDQRCYNMMMRINLFWRLGFVMANQSYSIENCDSIMRKARGW